MSIHIRNDAADYWIHGETMKEETKAQVGVSQAVPKPLDLCDALTLYSNTGKGWVGSIIWGSEYFIIEYYYTPFLPFPAQWGAERDVFNVIRFGFSCTSKRILERKCSCAASTPTGNVSFAIICVKNAKDMCKVDLRDWNRKSFTGSCFIEVCSLVRILNLSKSGPIFQSVSFTVFFLG